MIPAAEDAAADSYNEHILINIWFGAFHSGNRTTGFTHQLACLSNTWIAFMFSHMVQTRLLWSAVCLLYVYELRDV